ncbi:PAS domain S-box-containing protein [Bacillus ectoiniformans]|uniref:sigma 54-interacting transcriptional regulator n=1 Tax=Bacillus ectoiniformans TaxID=1494429 RepID=UPI00195AAC25|nr:sigma 54-interacting transcriptional regulator [Bacillus ectoiniformans]MBM7649823.1 PAS domain S-box-containing protein [Bacillus ectoiniformans]
MMIWRELLKPLPVTVHKNSTLQTAYKKMVEKKSDLAFVYDEADVVGYLKLDSLLFDMGEKNRFEDTIRYETDILKVTHHSKVEFYHNITVYLGVDEQGRLAGYTTEEKARALINEKKLEQVNESLDSAEIGMITTDKNLSILFMNETAETILGLSRSFLLKRNYLDLVHSDQDITEVFKGKSLKNVTTSFNFKKMSGHFSPVYKDGNIQGMVHIFFLQKQLDEYVKESVYVRELNEDLQAIYSAANEQLLVIDDQGIIIHLTGTFLPEFWQAETAEEMVGRSVYDLEEQGIFTPNIFSLCLEQRKKISIVQETKDGFQIWSTAAPVMDHDSMKKVVVISRDITSFNKLQEEINAARQTTSYSKSGQLQGDQQTFIYRSSVMSELVNQTTQIADSDSAVLIYGEQGTGKQLIAKHIHQLSQRSSSPFIRIHCHSSSEEKLMNQLFGYETESMDGQILSKKGLLEAAHGGTVLLNEVNELPIDSQIKLLEALQEKEISRIGGVQPYKIDVRIIATSTVDLQTLVKEKTFREDLYYYIGVLPFHVPALRHRKEDIAPLLFHFLEYANKKSQRKKLISREALQVLETYQWHGNINELRNVIERLVATVNTDTIQQQDVIKPVVTSQESTRTKVTIKEIMPLKEAVKELEEQLIRLAMEKYGKSAEVAKVLKVSPATISRRVNDLLK